MRADRVLVGHGRVGPVELVEPDGVDAEAAQGRLAGLPQVVRRAVEGPAAVAGTQVAALGGDQHLGGVGAVGGQGPGDQGLVVADLVGADVVGVGGVDEGDAGVERGVDGGDGAGLLGSALDRHRHAAESEGADLGVADLALVHAVAPCGFGWWWVLAGGESGEHGRRQRAAGR